MAKKDVVSPEPEGRSTHKLSQLFNAYHRYVSHEAEILLSELDYCIQHPNQIRAQRKNMMVQVQDGELRTTWQCPSEFDDWSNSGNVVNVEYRATNTQYSQKISSQQILNGVNIIDAGMVFTPWAGWDKVKFSLYLLYYPQAVVPQYLRDQCTDPRTGLLQFLYYKEKNSNIWNVAKWDKSGDAYQFWEIGHELVEDQLIDAFFKQANNVLPGVTDNRFDPISYDRYASLIPRVY